MKQGEATIRRPLPFRSPGRSLFPEGETNDRRKQNASYRLSGIQHDGHELGRVKELDATCFKLDARLAPDWWLDLNTIAGEQNGTFTLRTTREELGQARPEEEDHLGLHMHRP